MKKFFIGFLSLSLFSISSVAFGAQGDWSPDRPVRETGPTAVGFDYNVFNSFIKHRQLARNIRFQSNVDAYGDERDFVVAKIKNWGSTPYFHTLPNLKKGDRIWIQGYVHNSARETTINQFKAQNVKVRLDWSNPQEVVSVISADNAASVTDIVSLRFNQPGLTLNRVGTVDADYGNPQQTKTLSTIDGGNYSISSIPQVVGSYKGNHIVYWEFEIVDAVPSIEIDKIDQNGEDQDGTQQNDTQTINSGANAVFKITVRNNGNEPLKNVVVSDPEAPACNRTAAQTQSLYSGSTFAPGAQFSYNCTASGVTPASFADGDNDISVAAKGNGSNKDVSDADPSTVVFVNVGPAAIEVIKWANNPNDKDGVPTGNNANNDSQSIQSGSNAIFRIQVKNTANVALQNVRVTDNNAPQCGLTAAQVNQILTAGTSPKNTVSNVQKLSGTNSNNILEPNEGFQYDCTQPNVLDGYINSATVVGDPVNGNPSVSDNDPSTVLICNLTQCPPAGTPSIQINKTDVNTNDQDNIQRNDTQTIDTGEQAVFEITVTNNGREALRNVVVTDPESPSCALNANQTRDLYPGLIFDRGESFTFVCNRENVGNITFLDNDNDAYVTGIGIDSGISVNDEDPSVVIITTLAPICGDGVVELPEQCDDGNLINGDGCSNTCTVEPLPTCTLADFNPDAVQAGNISVFRWNTVNIAGNVDLRCSGSSGFNLDVAVPANSSRNITVPAGAALGTDTNCEIFYQGAKLCEDTLHTRNSICGDGVVETGEMCDDGNTVNGDGCSNTCQLEPTCVGTPFFTPNPTTPNSLSVFSWDTSNTGTDVTLNCSGPAITAFTKTVPANGSENINVPITAVNGSTATCRLVGNGTNIPGCAATLAVDTTIGPFCGDGIKNQPSEQCDDGNTNDNDSCSNSCQQGAQCTSSAFVPNPIGPNSKSTFSWTTTNLSGNLTLDCAGPAIVNFSEGVADNGSREVDVKIDAANGSTATCNLKDNGILIPSCAETLAVDTSVPFCGDGNVNQPSEQCDDGNNVDDDQCSNSCTSNIPPYAIEVLKWAANPQDKDGVATGNNNTNDTQTVESITTNNLDKAIFRIRVKNVGQNSLKDVQVQDANAAICALNADHVREILNTGSLVKDGISNVVVETEVTKNGILEAGERFRYDCTQAGTRDGYTNTAVAVGTPVNDSANVNDSDTSEVLVCNGSNCPPTGDNPSISLIKTDENTADFDGTQGDDSQLIGTNTSAVFHITVRNNGAESLKTVVVSDEESPACAKTASQTQALYPGNVFDPGESFTYTCEKTNANPGDFDGANGQGSVDGKNDARVDAKSTVDDADVNDEDASEVLFIAQCTTAQGQIIIRKDDSTPGQPDTDGDDTQRIANGGTATFTISVVNPGTTSISDVSVADSLSPSCTKSKADFMTLLGSVGNSNSTLDPGEVVTYTCTQINVTADFTNSATVTGLNRAVPCTVNDTDTTEVVVGGGGGGGFCGDGIVQVPEQCDLGSARNGAPGEACSNNCTTITCTNPPCGGGTPTASAVGTCAFNVSTGAALCTRKKPVEDVSDPLWQSYRMCRDGLTTPRHPIVTTIEAACALDWAEDQGLLLCGANIGGRIDPFADPTNDEVIAQCDPTIPPEPCVPVNTNCPECFKVGNSIVKQVRPGDLSQPLSTSATVAKGENAKYEVTVTIDGFNEGRTPTDPLYEILDAQIRVYDHTIPTESGNIFNRKGIEDGDGNATWKWCDENTLCPEYGEYFYQVLDASAISEINGAGGTTLQVHYDMDTAVASTKDTANIKNVAYAMIYYTYRAVDALGTVVDSGTHVAGFGANICQPTPPTKVSQLAQGTFGSVANVEIIRPFIKAKAGNAGYYSDGNADKAFADQNNILSPTDPNQNYGLTLTDDTTVYTGVEQGTADDFAQFQDQKDDFYNNLDTASEASLITVPGTSLKFRKLGSANVFQVKGDLNIKDLQGLSETSTFIISATDPLVPTDGNVIVSDIDNKIEFTNPNVFAAFIVRNGDLLINKNVETMAGMYLVEKGEIKSSPEPEVSNKQLKVSGNLFGDLGHLLAYRRFIGSGLNIEPSIEINFDLRLLNNTPPMLEQFLGEGWRQSIQE